MLKLPGFQDMEKRGVNSLGRPMISSTKVFIKNRAIKESYRYSKLEEEVSDGMGSDMSGGISQAKDH